LNLCYPLITFHPTVAENEPLDTWDEEETILTPDGDDEVRQSPQSGELSVE
jgi:hypothetical protein